MTKLYSENLSAFSVLPVDQGQMVEVAYAVEGESEVLVRRTRYSDSDVTYECAPLSGEGAFEPWNGELPDTDGEWRDCVVVD